MQTVKGLLTVLTAVLAVAVMQAPARADSGNDPFRGPWQTTGPHEVEAGRQSAPGKEPAQTVSQGMGVKGIRFFQNLLSPIDGNRCPMFPPCSSYGIHAIQKHGLFLGVIMTAARLTHEQGEMMIAPRIRTPDGLRFYDPVENNDFWFVSKNPTKRQDRGSK